jgi:hypothetical protein
MDAAVTNTNEVLPQAKLLVIKWHGGHFITTPTPSVPLQLTTLGKIGDSHHMRLQPYAFTLLSDFSCLLLDLGLNFKLLAAICATLTKYQNIDNILSFRRNFYACYKEKCGFAEFIC